MTRWAWVLKKKDLFEVGEEYVIKILFGTTQYNNVYL